MPTFSVWAPIPDRVELVLVDDGARRLAADRDDGGWWRAIGEVAPDDRYAWSLDGGEPLPDPRGPRMPDGVDGPSAVVDHAAFEWTDGTWRAPPLGSLVIYELHVGTFTDAGTFDAATEHLDHLVDLGVTAVEVLPIASFPGVHGWGYDGVGLYAPHEPYGGPDGFKRFVDACHAAGLAVILDVVYNHLGPMGNHLSRFGPYFTDRVTTPWGDAVNLDGPGSDEVRRFFVDNAVHWLRDHHVDGLRLDAVHALHDRSARPFLADLADEVAAVSSTVERPLLLIAESDLNDPTLVEPPELGGFGLDAMWADDLHHALHVALTGERDGYYADFAGTASEVARAVGDGYVYAGQHAPHRGRRHGRPLHPATRRDRTVAFLQNHDQIGNRARGERISSLATFDLYAAAALVLLGPAVPLLFQGEEWAASTPFPYFTDHPDPELAEAVRDGRRAEFAAFGWAPDDVPDPQDPATRARSVLRWEERDAPQHAAMLEWYRSLLALRRAEPALRDPRPHALAASGDDDSGVVRVQRGDVVIVADVGGKGSALDLGERGDVLLASPGSSATELSPGGAVVVRRARPS